MAKLDTEPDKQAKNPGDTGWQQTLTKNEATGAPLSAEERAKFNDLVGSYNKPSYVRQEEQPDAPSSSKDLGLDQQESSEPSRWKTSMGNTQSSTFSVRGFFKRHKKKLIWSLVGFGGIGTLFAGLIGPSSLIGDNLKVNFTTNWSYKFINLGNAHRSAAVQSKQWFGVPGCNDNTRWRCYNNRGVSQGQVDRLKYLGFNIEGLRAAPGDSSRFQFEAMTLREPSGNIVRITPDNAQQVLLENAHVRSTIDKVWRPDAFTNRNKRTMGFLRSKGIDRKPISADGTREENERAYRERNVNSAQGNISVDAPGQEGQTAAEQVQRQEGAAIFNDSIQTATESVDDYVENGTNPDNTPTTSILNNQSVLSNIAQTAGNVTLGGIKGIAQGPVANTISNACTYYQGLRLFTFIVQMQGQAQVLRAVYELFSTSDSRRVNEASEKQMSLLGDMLTRPSVEEATQGKTLGDSPAYTLITQGRVGNVGDLSRYNAGFTSASAVQSLLGTVSGNEGQLRTVCGGVNSVPGQITLSIIGIASCIGTAGLSCVAGAATGIIGGGILAGMAYYLIPTVASIVVGTYAIDALTDPQGSYGLANMAGYGAAIMGMQFGRMGGYGELSNDDYVALEQKTQKVQSTLAASDAINNRETGLFSPTNPTGIPTQLATAILPHIPSSLTATEAFSSIRSIASSGFSSLGSNLYAATPFSQETSLASMRGDLCQSPTFTGESFGTAKSGFCTTIPGPDPETLPPVDATGYDNNPYAFENLADWMQDNDYISEPPDAIDMGEPLSEAKGDFKEFVEKCRSNEEVFRDFDGALINAEGESRSMCNNKDSKYKRFDAYIQYRTVISAVEDASNGELGGEGSTGPSDSSGNLVDGTSQELAQQIIDSDSVTGDSRYMAQIQAVADGDGSCNINPTILQLVATMMRTYTMYISSLNRFCTNVLTASGTASYHYREQGGHAIDFAIINGKSSTGGTDEDIKFMKEAASLLPQNSGFGQVNCRPRIELPGMRQFNDTCHHVHIEVPVQ